ncbi:MAG: c-type cytochrome [Cyclobacteriaceae bacterium]|nr:c-type cytochrome [Cyclobacteriaceae bacterium]
MRHIILLNHLFLACVLISCHSNKPKVPVGFQVEPGFNLTLVANEPLIKDPVDLEFTESGEALVLEMPGYPFEDQQSKIILLKDTNQDGVYDDQILFAENLQLASSILPYKKGVLVAAPPYLLFIKDTNNDYKADVVDTLMGGFSTGNLQHNYNGLTYGIDNWIYAANGGNSGKPYWWGDPTTQMDLRGHDFRFNLESKTLERLGESSGGFGLGMDEFGHLFETHNLEHVSHLVFPDRYLQNSNLIKDHTLSNISDHEEDGLARVYPIGDQESRVNHPEQSGYFSGSCGITYYGGGAFGPEYENSIWVADVVLNLVHVDKVKANGAFFSASRIHQKKEFLASTDRSFRPVNMSLGPDGALYVVDMYRQVIEHPEWIPDEIEKTLDLQAGKEKGRIYRITKSNAENQIFNIDQFTSIEAQIESLKNPNQWIRKTAHRLLMDQTLTSDHINTIKGLLAFSGGVTRVHALWLLHSKNNLEVNELLNAFSNPLAGVRENALLISESRIEKNDSLIAACTSLLAERDARVRMQAGLTISTLTEGTFAKHKNQIFESLLTATAQPMDDWNVAAISLASKHSSADFFSKLISTNKEVDVRLLSSLAVISTNSYSKIQSILETLAGSKLSNDDVYSILNQLAAHVQPMEQAIQLISAISTLEKRQDVGIVSSLASIRSTLSLPISPAFLTYSKLALAGVLDSTRAADDRVKQIALIKSLPYTRKAEVLYACLAHWQPLKIQEEALRQLSEYEDPAIGFRILELWPTLGPQARKYAGDLLLYIEPQNDALLTGLEKGIINIGEMNFDLERRRQLLWWTDNERTKKRAEKLFSDSGVTTRKQAMESMKEALTLTGSQIAGAEIFQAQCALCHVYLEFGKEVGPVLTEINRKSKESIMHDILDPNAAVNTQYINHRIETKRGEIHLGMVEGETDQAITLKKMGGAQITIRKNEIKKFASLGTSLMPEGLEGSMSTQDLADLLAFLQQKNK